MRRQKHLVALVVILLLAGWQYLQQRDASPARVEPSSQNSRSLATDEGSARIAEAHARRQSDVQVRGEGVVSKLLADDSQGSRHQRFILTLDNGMTLLVAHNIDLAPRLDALRVGDRIRFNGEYEWNAKGGVLHWTHHDPAGRHEGGWLEHAGRRYE